MKKIILLIIFMVPMGACAQHGMSEADMQQMLQQAKKMEACMADIDQATLTSLSEKSQAMEQAVKSLCLTNKRDEAQKRAIEFGQEIAVNDEIKKMRQCGEMMQGMMPKIGLPTIEEMKKRHVCDDY